MGDLIEADFGTAFEVEYVFDGEKIIGVTHPLWSFRIQRKDNKIAMVCEETDEPFGELDRDVFSTILMCWLLIDDPEIIAKAEE